jgi:hypothetical protein
MTDGLGAWDPLTPAAVGELLESCPAPWWIAGGHAIDALVGEFDRRPHGDIDVGLLARDQEAIRATLAGWDLHCADPPGELRPWHQGEVLDEPIHDVWAREHSEGPWRLQLVLNPAERDDWIYRRDPRIRRRLAQIVWRSDGIPYLTAEIQLLFKSKTLRPKDDRDLADSLPHLSTPQRIWLRQSLQLSDPGHPWLGVI